jgi:hypothetical protein
MLSSVYEQTSNKVTLLKKLAEDKALEIKELSDQFTQTDLFNSVARKLDMTANQLNEFLWSNYQPYNFWVVVAAIGAGTVVLLVLYDQFILKRSENAAK